MLHNSGSVNKEGILPPGQHASSSEEGYRKQLASWSVDTIFAELTRAQRRCRLLQEDLYTRAALESISMQQWRAFQGAVQALLDFLGKLQEGEPIKEAWVQERDAYINLLDRYLDEPVVSTHPMNRE